MMPTVSVQVSQSVSTYEENILTEGHSSPKGMTSPSSPTKSAASHDQRFTRTPVLGTLTSRSPVPTERSTVSEYENPSSFRIDNSSFPPTTLASTGDKSSRSRHGHSLLSSFMEQDTSRADTADNTISRDLMMGSGLLDCH